jgi:hypothetical protein
MNLKKILISFMFLLLVVLSGCNSATTKNVSEVDKNSLPIGTVVKLKELDEKIMIYGNNVTRSTDNKKYRYLGCFYPDGFTSNDYNVFFNANDIEEVYYLGYKE